MEAILHVTAFIFGIVLRTAIMIVAIPFVLIWPRKDKTLPYWPVVRRRFGKVAELSWS